MITIEGFIKYANLPLHKVKAVAASDIIPEVVTELVNNYHIDVIVPAPVASVQGAERYHADMSLFHLGRNSFITDDANSDLAQKLISMGGKVQITQNITAKEPKLNACMIKDRLICNSKITDDMILRYCAENSISILHTNQMYTKCSAAVVSDNAVITSDESIYRLCVSEGLDALKVSCEGIALNGYSYGFIGGCCGLISNDVLAFSGDIRLHSDFGNIKDFARQHGVYVVSLSRNMLYDIGGIIPITERTNE